MLREPHQLIFFLKGVNLVHEVTKLRQKVSPCRPLMLTGLSWFLFCVQCFSDEDETVLTARDICMRSGDSNLRELLWHLRVYFESLLEHVEVINLPNGQRGVFACTHMEANTYICEYWGDYITEEEALQKMELYQSMALTHMYMLKVRSSLQCVHVHHFSNSLYV